METFLNSFSRSERMTLASENTGPLIVGSVSGIIYVVLYIMWHFYIKKQKKKYSAQPDESNIYNISSRVQGSTHQYPDAYISVDHIAITNELNKPPKYDDAPPSYEEAIKLATAHSNQTFQAEEATRQNQPQTSAATTSVVPAVPSRTTE